MTAAAPAVDSSWPGSWVADHLGVVLTGDPALPDLVGLALRRNPRRAHLLVSRVLGKHVPTDPRIVWSTGRRLGDRVYDVLQAAADPVESGGRGAGVVVLGYAETATGLGHCVADALPGCYYLHSTRRSVAGIAPVAGFEEEHSHATAHLLSPEDPAALHGTGPLVLVDDELSTGRTVRNTIVALQHRYPRTHYVVATLVDLRSAADEGLLTGLAAALGVRIDVVVLARGEVALPAELPARVAELAIGSPDGVAAIRPLATVRRFDGLWPRGLREGGRHGYHASDRTALAAALPMMAAEVAAAVRGHRVLVLGVEELMYAPLRFAVALAEALLGCEVRFSSSTRSPALAIDAPGYALRTALRYQGPDGPRCAYNVAPGAGEQPFDTIVLVHDDASEELIEALRGCCGQVIAVPIPPYLPAEPLRGPAFGSYPAADVGWLLTDLSGLALEAPTEEREEAIQAGGRHYAESLPIEYVPTAEYQQLFSDALAASATRVAEAVGVVTELVCEARDGAPVLVSLARAGTPIGLLMRRWAALTRGVSLPHYAVSIVRGRGIDQVALRWLARHHDPAAVMFIDGWTGKGAIARELAAAVSGYAARTGAGFAPDLAVLADPGHCVRIYGTRADYLVPSACLNSTVSGLISRTVLNDELIGPADFHGAKFYAELAGSDVSGQFIDAVTACFPAVVDAVQASLSAYAGTDHTPTWRGWAAVDRISAEYGIGDVNLVKPGVGETTRVLLRRVPWRILARPDAVADLAHVLLLAEQRGVPVELVADLPYSCVGLIHPRYTRGATGFTGTAAQ